MVVFSFKDKKIAVIGESRYEWACTYMSVVCGVGTIIPIDKELPYDEIKYLLEFSEASCIVCSKAILNKMPESYKPAARQINEALAEAEKAKAELEAAKAELAKLKGESVVSDETQKPDVQEAAKAEKNFDEMSYPELQAEVKKLGGNHTQKKDALIEFLKNATLEAAE